MLKIQLTVCLLLLAVTACNKTEEAGITRSIKYYQCSMDPQITLPNPGKCTICGMTLAPVYENDSQNAETADGSIKLSQRTADVIGIATAPVMPMPVKKTLRIAGNMTDDETKHRVLSARVPGRIEKLYVNQVGIEVAEGQPLAEFYSPDVLTAQRLYLENLQIAEKNALSLSELSTSKEKLLGYGLVAEDIALLEQTQKPNTKFTLRAPFNGIVTARNIYEGQYVNVNDTLFEVGDFTELWFIGDVYERDLPLLRLNQKVDVTLTSLPNETQTAPLAFIDPNLNPVSRTARVRVVLPNPKGRILNNQTAEGIVHIETPPVLSIPRSALLYTHQKPAVYIEQSGQQYQLREVTLGVIGDDTAEVLSGVQEYEKVVVQSALLIDSQSALLQAAVRGRDMQRSETFRPAALPDSFVEAVFCITAALAADDLGTYQQHLPAVQETVKHLPPDVLQTLQPLTDKLVTGTGLTEVRRPFEVFSNAVADIVKAQPKDKRQAFIFQCPMSPVLGTARWIQKENKETLNPFFGSEMLNCGTELQ